MYTGDVTGSKPTARGMFARRSRAFGARLQEGELFFSVQAPDVAAGARDA